jgi:TonB family protein
MAEIEIAFLRLAQLVTLLLLLRQSSLGAEPATDLPQNSNRPIAINSPRPEYPYEARSKRITGGGVCSLAIDPATGTVTAAVMKESTGSEILDNSALSTYRRWRFKPGVGGSHIDMPISFTMTGAHTGLAKDDLNTADQADKPIKVSPSAALPQATAPPPPSRKLYVVVTKPVKIKVAYGETTLPVGMRLPVLSTDASTVRVQYVGAEQSIPIESTRLEEIVNPNNTLSPTVGRPPTASGLAERAPTVALQTGYDTRMAGGDITMRELQSIRSRYCSADVDLSGAGGPLYNGVRYLMDDVEAVRILGLPHTIASRGRVATPGFPRSSLSYSTFDAMFEGQFNRVILVTDARNKVVCMQLVDEHPKSRDEPDEEDTWSTYNFIQPALRASDTMKVGIKSWRGDDVIAIEARLFQTYTRRVGHKTITDHTELKQKTKLLIPIPFARIILHCVQRGLSK